MARRVNFEIHADTSGLQRALEEAQQAMPELFTIKEAAAYLQVSEETLRKWRAQGVGPPVAKLGRHLRYRKDALDQWIKQQEGER